MEAQHRVGDVIGGRYRVTAVIGSGGVATTYVAEDLQGGPRVAVKQLLLWKRHDWKVLELFEREANTLAQLDHPAIPRYRDYVQAENDGAPAFYLVQELADGRSLKAWSDGGFRPTELQVRRIADELLGILSYLHGRQPAVVHRDIKPDNLIWRADGSLALVDFGAVQDPAGTEHGSTVVGTYGFMAPEQFRGSATPQTDLYGVAATCVYLLSRRTPAELPEKAGEVQIQGTLDVSADFAEWLERLLQRDPAKRFASASDARSALSRVRASKTSRKNLALAALAAAVVLPGAVAAGWHFGSSPLQSAPPAPVGAAVNAKPRADLRTQRTGRIRWLRNLSGHWSAVFGVATAPQGTWVITTSADKTAKLWDFSTAQPVRSFVGHQGKIGPAAVTRDGKLVITPSDAIRVFELANGKLLRTLPGHGQQATGLALSPDDQRLLSTGFDGQVRLWDVESGALLKSAPAPRRCFAAAWASDGAMLAAACEDGAVRLYDPELKELSAIKAHTKAVNDVCFTADAQTLVSAGDDHEVAVYSLVGSRIMHRLRGHADEVWTVAVAPDGKTLLSGSKDETIRLWDLYTGKQLDALHYESQPVLDLAFTADGQSFFAALGRSTASVFTIRQPSWQPPPVDAPVVEKPPEPLPADTPPERRLYVEGNRLLGAADTGNERQARALYQRAIEANPRFAPAYLGLARVERNAAYLSRYDYRPEGLKAAHRWIDRAMALDPSDSGGYLSRARTFMLEKRYPEARAALEEARRRGADANEISALALVLGQREEKEDEVFGLARGLIEAGAAAEAYRSDAYDALTWVYRRRHEYDAAERTFRSLVNLRPESAWTKGNFARFLIWIQKHDDAIHWAKAALAQLDYGMGRLTLADAYAGKARALLEKSGPSAEVERLLADAEKALPVSADAAFVRGLLHRAQGNPVRARLAFEQALLHDPEHAEAKDALGRKE